MASSPILTASTITTSTISTEQTQYSLYVNGVFFLQLAGRTDDDNADEFHPMICFVGSTSLSVPVIPWKPSVPVGDVKSTYQWTEKDGAQSTEPDVLALPAGPRILCHLVQTSPVTNRTALLCNYGSFPRIVRKGGCHANGLVRQDVEPGVYQVSRQSDGANESVTFRYDDGAKGLVFQSITMRNPNGRKGRLPIIMPKLVVAEMDDQSRERIIKLESDAQHAKLALEVAKLAYITESRLVGGPDRHDAKKHIAYDEYLFLTQLSQPVVDRLALLEDEIERLEDLEYDASRTLEDTQLEFFWSHPNNKDE